MKSLNFVSFIIILFLVLLNALLLRQNTILKENIVQLQKIEQDYKQSFILSKIPNFSLINLNNRTFRYIHTNSVPMTLFLFFSPLDCAVCLQELKYLSKIYNKFNQKEVRIIGIANHPDKRELKHYVDRMKITFPVLYDERAMLTHRLKIPSTPFKILVDSEGNIIHTSERHYTSVEQQSYCKKLKRIIENYLSKRPM